MQLLGTMVIATAISVVTVLWLFLMINHGKVTVLIGLIMVSATGVLSLLLPEIVVSNLDEFVILSVFMSGVLHTIIRRKSLAGFPGLPFILLFVLMGVISGVIGHVQFDVLLQGTFLASKGILFGIGVAQFDWEESDRHRIVIMVAVVGGFLLSTGAMNVILGQKWDNIFAPDVILGDVMGFRSLVGPYDRPAAFARISAMVGAAILAYAMAYKRRMLVFLFGVSLIAMSLLALTSRTVVALIVAIVALLLVYRRSRAAVFWLIIGAAFLVTISGMLVTYVGADVERYVLNESSARSLLMSGAVSIGAACFPLGAGFGMYGSAVAAQTYSPLYLELGFNSIYGLSPDSGASYLTDTTWAAILGESGWIGTAFFVMFFVRSIAVCWRASGSRRSLASVCGCVCLMWLLMFVVESVAAPVFGSVPGYVFLYGALGILGSLRNENPPPDSSCDVFKSAVRGHVTKAATFRRLSEGSL